MRKTCICQVSYACVSLDSIGVGAAQSTLGARHFCPKIYVWKIDKIHEVYIFARKLNKINKIPEFCMILVWKIFSRFFSRGGEGEATALSAPLPSPRPPSPTPMLKSWRRTPYWKFLTTPLCASLTSWWIVMPQLRLEISSPNLVCGRTLALEVLLTTGLICPTKVKMATGRQFLKPFFCAYRTEVCTVCRMFALSWVLFSCLLIC